MGCQQNIHIVKFGDIGDPKMPDEKIEYYSRKKAEELNLELDEGIDNEYFRSIYKSNNGSHTRQ
jgi:hypothetical protein